MPDPLPRKSKSPTQEAFETLAFLWGGVAVAAFFGNTTFRLFIRSFSRLTAR